MQNQLYVQLEISHQDQQLIQNICQFLVRKHGLIDMDGINNLKEAEIREIFNTQKHDHKAPSKLPILNHDQISLLIHKIEQAAVPHFGTTKSNSNTTT